MNAVLAVVAGGRPDGQVIVARMLDEMRRKLPVARSRPGEILDAGGAVLAAAYAGGPTQQPATATEGGCAVAVDSALYYRADLANRIGVTGQTDALSDASLVAHAIARQGEPALELFEGDFALVAWDRQTQTLVAARDFVGHRTLYWCDVGGQIVIASTIAGILAHPAVRPAVDLDRVAETAAGLWSHSDRTAFTGIHELQAGFALRWRPGEGVRLRRYWSPPEEILNEAGDSDDAAHELLDLLSQATRERLAERTSRTALLLSGGWDSTSLFGAAHHVLRTDSRPHTDLASISMSYPEGDSAREDETIVEAVAHWGSDVTWVDIAGVSMLGADPDADARDRDDPAGHVYEGWNRTLYATARGLGASVVFAGGGGDQLFQVSMVYVADLVRRGKLVEAWQQWTSRGLKSRRMFLRAAILPRLPDWGFDLIGAMRGRRPQYHLDRLPPPWFRADFVASRGFATRDLETRPPLPQHSAVLAEGHSFFVFQFFPRVFGRLYRFGLEEGVELRQPLMDRRVVEFAMRRPWFERANRRETKILLRKAMRGLLPDSVLAPRQKRTGTTFSFFVKRLIAEVEPRARAMLNDSLLAELGVIEPRVVDKAWSTFARTNDDELGIRLFRTYQADLWLREHRGLLRG